MKSKLGVYQISKDDLPLEWYDAQPVLAVSMFHNPSFWREVKARSPNTRLMGRFYFEPDWPNVIDAFHQMRESVLQMAGIYDLWMGINEPVLDSEQDAIGLAAWTITWAQLMHGIGAKVAAFSFSQGAPKLEYWPRLWDGLRACDVLALHEYDAPEMWRTQGWRCLRYRKVHDLMPDDLKSKPVWISETGIDGGALDDEHAQQGWRKFGDEAHYLESLRWYDQEIQRDPQVVGAAIFAAAWDQGKASFNVNRCESIREYIASGGAPTPLPEEPPDVEPIIEFSVSPEQSVPGANVVVSYRGENIAGAWLRILTATSDAQIPLAPAVGQKIFQPVEETQYHFVVLLTSHEYTSRVKTVAMINELPDPTPTPDPEFGYIDSRIKGRVSITQGSSFKVRGVWFMDDTKAPFPKAGPNEKEAQDICDVRCYVMGKNGAPLPGVWVVLDWPDECNARLTECDGTVQIFIGSGPYDLIVGDCKVSRIELFGHHHVRYQVQVQKVT